MTMRELIEKLKERPKTSEAELAQRRDEWLQAVNSLFDSIEEWLAEAVRAGVLKVRRSTAEIDDPDLGAYQAPILRIEDDRSTVRLETVGARVVGTVGHPHLRLRGRIDLICGPIKIPLVRDENNAWMALPRQGDPVELTAETFAEILGQVLLDE